MFIFFFFVMERVSKNIVRNENVAFVNYINL